MKIFKIVFISIGVILVVLIAAAVIFIKTLDINQYKPQIITQAKSALNRDVNFEKASLDISLTRGVNLKIKNLVVSEDPAFQKGDFLTVKDISVSVNVLAYLFRKTVDVPNILIDSPRITVIRQKDGSLNVQSLQPASGNAVGKVSGAAAAPLALPAVLISSLKLENGIVTYIDRSFEPAVNLDVSDLAVTVSKISLTEAFPFVVEAAVLSAKKNIRVEGNAQIDLKTNEVTVSGLKGASDLSALLLDKIPAAFPMAKGAVLPVELKGMVDVNLEKLTAGPKGLGTLNADASLANGVLQFKEIPSPVKNIGMKMKITGSDLLFDKVSAAIGEGLITASGGVEDYQAKQGFNGAVDIKNIKIQDVLASDKIPVKVEGIVSGPVKLKGQGFTPQSLSSLSGEGEIAVTQAKLRDINVLRTVLDKITVIPGLSEKIEAKLSDRYKQKLTQKDTALSDMKIPFSVENGRVLVKDAAVGVEEFSFKGKAAGGFDGTYEMDGDFLISKDLSAEMVTAVSEMQYFLNDDKQIFIPLKVSGGPSGLKFSVDAEYLGKKIAVNEAKTHIMKALDKVVGPQEPSANGQNTPQTGTGEKSSTEKAVENVLGKIFGK